MNLSTARFSNRGKEIAIRKVSGATRMILTKQFLAEALLVTILSVVLSIALVNVLLPAFNSVYRKRPDHQPYHTDLRNWIGVF
jgi:putative ABC transport system permease protein